MVRGFTVPGVFSPIILIFFHNAPHMWEQGLSRLGTLWISPVLSFPLGFLGFPFCRVASQRAVPTISPSLDLLRKRAHVGPSLKS